MLTKNLYLFTIPVILLCTILSFISARDVAGVNQAPVAQNQNVNTNEDTSKAITLVATDADGNPLTYTVVSGSLHGTLTGTPPILTYKPAANYNGADSFTFKANDGSVDSNIATVSITVLAVNDPPVAQNKSMTTRINKARAITLTGTDVDNDPLTYQIVAQPLHGTLTGTPPTVNYTPRVNYTGSDSFTFKANDGKADSTTATVSITVTVNHAPVAQNQTVTTNEDTARAITLVATDADTDPLTYTIVSGPPHGTFTGTPPILTYKPALNYNGSDSFTFKANDGMVDSNIATVSITAISLNDGPVAQNQSVSTDKNKAKAITLVATDVEADLLTYQIVAQPLHGTLSGTPPNVTYTPATNYSGPDSFTFKANDGKVTSNAATVSITVVNHAPVAQNQTVTTNEDTGKAIILVATDADSDPLAYQIVTQPGHGKLTGTAPNTTYIPHTNFSGSDSFTFRAYDGKLYSNTATVSITIAAVNDPPAAQNQSISTNKRTAKTVTLVATDVDGDLLTYTIVSAPSHGTLNGAPPNITYTPEYYYSGVDSFTFKANDGKIASNVAKITITVVDRPPVAQSQSVTAYEDTPRTITLGATDPDGDLLSYYIVAGPSHGKLTGYDWNTNWIYTPNSNYNGPDSFTFKANSGMLYSNVATVSIMVTPVDDPPVAQDQSTTVVKNSTVPITLLATDSEGDILAYQVVTGPGHGTLSGTPPNLSYTPKAEYNGPDSFTFKAYDGQAYSNVATVSITVSCIITTVAGNGIEGFSGDSHAANQAQLNDPYGVAADASGNLYISDNDNLRIRKVNGSGIITTVAGNGMADCWSAGPALHTGIGYPEHLAVDATGNVYFADPLCHRIRKVDTSGILTTVAGSVPSCCYSNAFSGGYGGDGGLATAPEAALNYPEGVTADGFGNLYIADTYNHRIRKVDTKGIITTVAGNGSPGRSGDGGPAMQAQLYGPSGVALDTLGNLYIADETNNCIRKVDAKGIITTVAGSGLRGYGGDGGLATLAQLCGPKDVTADVVGNIYIMDEGNQIIRRLDPNGMITSVAGVASATSCFIYSGAYSGDGGPATQAQLYYPYGVALDPSGNLYSADTSNQRVRKIEGIFVPPHGIITGRVTDSSTGVALSNVDVKITTLLSAYTGKTDSNGSYTVSGLPPGDFAATCVKAGYIQQAINGTLGADQTLTLNVQLTQIPLLTVTITSPQDSAIVNSSPIGVTGNVSNNAEVTVNGTQASVSNNAFSVSLVLSEGPNTLTATATDQNGRTASQTIHVTLVTKGTVSGTVKDSSTGLPLPSATVSVTDSLNQTMAALTNTNGRYAISGIASGAFDGSVTKGGYTPYNFSGTVSAGQTVTIDRSLNPILPIISNIAVSGITTSSGTIIWTTDQSTSSLVNYGPTTFYGSSVADSTLSTSHAIILTNLTSGTTYHFRVASKNGYGISSFSGDLTFVTVGRPTISAIVVSKITANSSTVTWTTDQPSDSSVDYGTTTSYGISAKVPILTTSHVIILSNLAPGTTYHFKVTSKNGYGISSSSGDNSFATLTPNPITLVITSPSNNATISRSDILVKGTITNSTGNETGVVVNGMIANVYGNEFVANHVPLMDGSNTITVTATDTGGYTQTAFVIVTATTRGDYIRIVAAPASGIAPLQTTLSIDSSLDLSNATISCAGPGTVDFLPPDASGTKATMSTEGIYYCTTSVNDPSGKTYDDRVAVTVLPKIELDNLLRAKWEGMKGAFANKDVQTVLIYLIGDVQDRYNYNLNLVKDHLPTIVQAMPEIRMVDVRDGIAEYEMIEVQNGEESSFYIEFIQDVDGTWKISFF